MLGVALDWITADRDNHGMNRFSLKQVSIFVAGYCIYIIALRFGLTVDVGGPISTLVQLAFVCVWTIMVGYYMWRRLVVAATFHVSFPISHLVAYYWTVLTSSGRIVPDPTFAFLTIIPYACFIACYTSPPVAVVTLFWRTLRKPTTPDPPESRSP